jgi:hypothetical protein
MLVVTLGGIFILSTLIGVLSSGLESKLDALRKGRSIVIERGHTVILGFSGEVFPIIEQLILANENQRRARIVIMADRDKTEMEEALRERLPERKTTKLIARSGSPTSIEDLAIINAADARSIIILADAGEHPDAQTIKTILAVMKDRRRSGGNAAIVAEIQDTANIEPALIASEGKAVLVRVSQLVSRIIAQSCRQSGLSQVYLELLDFEGNEIYFRGDPRLTGMKYRDALALYSDATALGVARADGTAALNPPQDYLFREGDQLIVLAADDEIEEPKKGGARAQIQEQDIQERGGALPAAEPEKTLVLAWNHKVPLIISELEGYVAEGSSVLVASEDQEAANGLQALAPKLKKQKIKLSRGDTSSRAFLEALNVGQYDQVVVMSPASEPSKEEADAKSLVTLLQLRDIAKSSEREFAIVSEILDLRNRELADSSEADDFIVGERILSLMMAMLSENPRLEPVFEDLFDSGGAEIYLKPASDYVREGRKTNFATVLEAAARQGQTAIGYSLARFSSDPEKAYGIVLNPGKADEETFAAGDRIVVLAED